MNKTVEGNKLITEFNSIVGKYVKAFCEKHRVDFAGWVANQIGTIGCFGDSYLNFDDIRLDIDENINNKVIWEWYNYSLENRAQINFYSYSRDARL